ncbi:lycopene cyclase family protein [Mesonia sp. MT50]|uniref:Lycopene cyclase family protein n=1 Tax=Mesonia profundi TaxID=3070998 RepID=A0ABU0ZZC5_9FLAO|nr:lycopene cyclase family protein [Mesonia profundi]MDQ7916752.1 lycopene cyclase family protein [Mesonia profundi]
MQSHHYDYIIVGSGLAGLQLGLALSKDVFFKNKKIALIDKSSKSSNDKTWCFWEKGKGQWENIIHKSWKEGFFISDKENINLNLSPYTYKMIRSIDFYENAKTQLANHPSISFIEDSITAVEEDAGKVMVVGKKKTYTSSHVFDSRISPEYFENKNESVSIHQHFKGWMIETEDEFFNPETFTMMDYRLQYKNSTSFTYVLPITKKKAFVEFTFFTPFTVEENVYDLYLERYVKEILKLQQYKITATEIGIIPMTNFSFQQYNYKRITKIGTAGGWVKPSSGYAFKHTEKKASLLIENLKNNLPITTNFHSKKYHFLDTIFLKVLHNENSKGKWIFEQLYLKNSTPSIFKFLDEETSVLEDFKIVKSLYSKAFIKALFQ